MIDKKLQHHRLHNYWHALTLLQKIVKSNKEIHEYITFAYNLKKKSLSQHIELLITKEQQKCFIYNEYKLYLDDLNTSSYKYVAPLLDTYLHPLSPYSVWYERLHYFVFAPKISKQIDYFLYKFPDSQHLRKYSDLSERKSVEFWLTFDAKRKYVKDLLELLTRYEQPEPQSELLPEPQTVEWEKEIMDYKQQIETLKARVVDLESENKTEGAAIDIFWNKPKIDLIRLWIVSFLKIQLICNRRKKRLCLILERFWA
ncbi:MAG: hypothetical protein RLZZ628_3204 [Bacteroidota bacterium]|jgi:hypothetical protein